MDRKKQINFSVVIFFCLKICFCKQCDIFHVLMCFTMQMRQILYTAATKFCSCRFDGWKGLPRHICYCSLITTGSSKNLKKNCIKNQKKNLDNLK